MEKRVKGSMIGALNCEVNEKGASCTCCTALDIMFPVSYGYLIVPLSYKYKQYTIIFKL